MQRLSITTLLLSIIETFIMSSNTNAASNNSLTVAIDGLRNRKGQICLSLFSDDQGFPNKSDRALQVQCVKAEDTPWKSHLTT